ESKPGGGVERAGAQSLGNRPAATRRRQGANQGKLSAAFSPQQHKGPAITRDGCVRNSGERSEPTGENHSLMRGRAGIHRLPKSTLHNRAAISRKRLRRDKLYLRARGHFGVLHRLERTWEPSPA